MRIFDHPQHRLAAGKPSELVEQRRERAAAALLRRQRAGAVAGLCVDAQQGGDQRCARPRLVHAHREQRLKPFQPALRSVAFGKAGRIVKLLDHRVERRICVVGRTLVAQQEVRLGARGVDQRFREARLADPGLAAEQHHLTFAGLGLAPTLNQ